MFADPSNRIRLRTRFIFLCRQFLILTALVAGGSLVASPASAGGGMGAAAAAATGALSSCGSNSGKALYDCVANVLDRMSSDISAVPATQSALRSAAAKLRVAANKTQALSAISQCRALIAAAIRKVRTIGSAEGWASSGGDGSGLEAIGGVLSRAASLIQSKG